jgi:hypothetical protein
MTSAEMRFMGRISTYTWQGCKTNKYNLSELKISPGLKLKY